MKIVVIDYGLGNLGSIMNMLKKIGAEGTISSEVLDIEGAEKLILPGVGNFDQGMRNLSTLGLLPILEEKVIRKKTSILGICLGMQLFARKSEEGNSRGLEWIDAEVVRFKFDERERHIKIPHMGWNLVNICQKNSLFEEMHPESRFYFVHSYHVVCKNEGDILTKTFHGYEFASAVRKENIYGAQFHPEKSHKFGMKLLRNFVEFC
ncbi:MAG: imidazole glycerol phosphate synthase subunit HisH [Deltaproteobacteria bacterium]|nr:imidazole glycerol phosphate synthase subunit HisH [Deltaproteobacteria bacterium]